MTERNDVRASKLTHARLGAATDTMAKKYSYAELELLVHNLSQQVQVLTKIQDRMAHQLEKIHASFEEGLSEDSKVLIDSLNAEPALVPYSNALTQLFISYDTQIETSYRRFEEVQSGLITVEQLYRDVVIQNNNLRQQLIQKTKQLLEISERFSLVGTNGTGNSSNGVKMPAGTGGDYIQILQAQRESELLRLASKCQNLEKQNQGLLRKQIEASRFGELERKYKATSERNMQLETANNQLTFQIQELKDQIVETRASFNRSEAKLKQLNQTVQREEMQLRHLLKEKENVTNSCEGLKQALLRVRGSNNQAADSKNILDLRHLIEILKAEKMAEDDLKMKSHRDHTNRVTQLEGEVKGLRKSLESIEKDLAKEQQRRTDAEVELEKERKGKNEADIAKTKAEKYSQEVSKRVQAELAAMKGEHQKAESAAEMDFSARLSEKQQLIFILEQSEQKLMLQNRILESDLQLLKGAAGTAPGNPLLSRQIQRMKENLAIKDEFYQGQLKTLNEENTYLQKELEAERLERKQAVEQNLKLSFSASKFEAEAKDARAAKESYMEQLKKVKAELESDLKQKEQRLVQKCAEIKTQMDEAERRHRTEKEKLTREAKQNMEELKNLYQERFRVLENHVSRRK